MSLQSHQLINQTSGETDIHTPPEILNLVRAVLGEIELDPASSAAANERVKAKTFYVEPEYETPDPYAHVIHDPDHFPHTIVIPLRRYKDWGGIV